MVSIKRNKNATGQKHHPAHEIRDFARIETDIRPYRATIFQQIATGTSLGGNPLDFLRIALRETLIPPEVNPEKVDSIAELASSSKSLAECLDKLDIMRPFELKVLREAERMDGQDNGWLNRDRAIRIISQYHQWSSENRSSSELAFLLCRMSVLSFFFHHPLVSDAISGDPFLIQDFGNVKEAPGMAVWESMHSLDISEFYVAVIRLAETKDKLAKGFELLATIERD